MSGHDIIIVRTEIGGDNMSPRTGRPPLENPKTARIEIRVSPDEKQEIMEYAKCNKISLLELLKTGIMVHKTK